MPALAIGAVSAGTAIYGAYQGSQSNPSSRSVVPMSPRAQIGAAAIGAGANIYGTYAASQAADQAAGIQRGATKAAMAYQNKAYQQERADIERERTDFLERQAYTRAQTAARQERLAPFAGMGLAALAQLREPLYRPDSGSGTLADLMLRRTR